MVICFDVYHHPRILVIIFYLFYFLHFCILVFKTCSLLFKYICYLHSVLHVINYGINKIYFVITVFNVLLFNSALFGKRDSSIAEIK